MKLTARTLFCGCSLALILASPATVLSAPEESGTIKTVRGDVRIERDGKPSEARVGDAVHVSDRIVTGGDGSAGITLKDDTLLTVGANSTLVIERFAFNPTTNEGSLATALLKGTLQFITGLIARANPRAVAVHTPTATLGIRGTEFIVEVPAGE